MASRKRAPDPNQIGLVLPSAEPSPVPLPEIPPPADFDLEALDDYPEDETRLRLVDPPAPPPRVTVESEGHGKFWVSWISKNGGTSASWKWTREELIELIQKATAALELKR